MKILAINAGSSSVKYRLFDMDRGEEVAGGLLEKIGEPLGRMVHHIIGDEGSTELIREQEIKNHRVAMELISAVLTESGNGVISDKSELAGIGHRVVHGGEDFQEPVLIDERVMESIRRNIPLAPVHNPVNLIAIEESKRVFPETPQIAVFDTAFHQTIPPWAFHYGLPYETYEKHRVRRYGFHGTSHAFVARAAAEYLGQPLSALNLITLHLGNGASMTAVEKGRSVDTTMGMTPLEGLMMGTRCGDLDPAIHFYLAEQMGLSMAEIDTLMNKKSGLKGLCGVNDMREIFEMEAAGDGRAKLALDIYTYRIKKYLGAYLAVLGTLDAIVFTGGIGENAAEIRRRSCAGLEGLGLSVDEAANARPTQGIREIQAACGPVKILVIPTNEEKEIARQTSDLL